MKKSIKIMLSLMLIVLTSAVASSFGANALHVAGAY